MNKSRSTQDWQGPDAKALFKAFLKLKTPAEVAKFMRDLGTLSEIGAMAERWQVVQRLNKGMPYRKIAKETGASTATVTRVAHWLHHGEGGYRLVLKRLQK